VVSGEDLIQDTKRLAIVSLFGVIIFVSKSLLPSPINKMLIFVQALLLALGALLIGNLGATFVSLIGGILTALWNIALTPFTLFFALLYGLLVDAFFSFFKIGNANGEVKMGRLVAAMTLSTMLIGFLSYYTTVHLLGVILQSLPIEVAILSFGTLNGAAAGFLASKIWNKRLKNVKL